MKEGQSAAAGATEGDTSLAPSGSSANDANPDADTATSTTPAEPHSASNDNDPLLTLAEEAGHENKDTGQQESGPENQPQKIIAAHDDPAPRADNENTPLSDVSATGTE